MSVVLRTRLGSILSRSLSFSTISPSLRQLWCTLPIHTISHPSSSSSSSCRCFATTTSSKPITLRNSNETAEERAEKEQVLKWLDTFEKTDIPVDSFTITHARSSGAGGQNVNKVNTKVEMRFYLADAKWIPSYTMKHLREQERGRITAKNEFIITSERHRTQQQNYDDCIDKLFEMLIKASYVPPDPSPEKIARIQQHHDANERRRKEDKKRASQKKAARRGGDYY